MALDVRTRSMCRREVSGSIRLAWCSVRTATSPIPSFPTWLVGILAEADTRPKRVTGYWTSRSRYVRKCRWGAGSGIGPGPGGIGQRRYARGQVG